MTGFKEAHKWFQTTERERERERRDRDRGEREEREREREGPRVRVERRPQDHGTSAARTWVSAS